MDLNNEIENLYNCEHINKMICRLTPPHLQGDLKQELFIELFNTDKDKLIYLFSSGDINYYCVRLVLNMQSKTGVFNKKYCTNFDKAKDYLRSQISASLPEFDLKRINVAIDYLKEKEKGTAIDSHEYIIFNHYIELRSLDKVAAYFGIPKHHVWVVVSNIQNELKKLIKNG